MGTLVEFRQKYPQYDDVPDAELADRLYKKHYSDMPRDQFDAKIGFTPEPGFGFNPDQAFDPASITPRKQPSVGASFIEGINSDQLAGSQQTAPKVRDAKGEFTRGTPEGELSEFDFGQAYYDKAGNLRMFNAEHQVALRDSASGKMLVFNRTPETDENAALGAYRIMAPGLATGRVHGAVKAAQAAQTAAKPLSRAQQTVGAFDRSGVDVSLPAVTPNRAVSGTAHALKETIVGQSIPRGVDRQIGQAGQRAEDIAAMSSDVGDAATAGERVRRGAQEFKALTVPLKQAELYNNAAVLIPKGARSNLSNTLRQIGNVEMRIADPAIREFVTDSNFQKLAQTIRQASQSGLSFDDLRELRTQVRGLRAAEGSAVGVNKTAVQAIYDGLTKDMLAVAELGGKDAVRAIKQADRYTAAAMGSRMPTVDRVADAASGEKVYAEVMRLAQTGAGADWRRLAQIKRSMPHNEWLDMRATVIRQMGMPTAGAVTAADATPFSVSTFVTNWNKMSDAGKSLMFGSSSETRKALDDLATVVGELKRVERLSNPSGTGRIAIAAAQGTGGIMGMAYAPMTTAIVAGVGLGVSKVLSSPRAARFLVRAGRLQKSLASAPPNRRRGIQIMLDQHISRIPAIAAQDREMARALQQMAGAGASEPQEDLEATTP